MSAASEFAAKMAALSASFARRTMEEAAELEALVTALLLDSDGSEQRARIQYLAHRIAGGSSTFGLVTLEIPASELESCLLDNAAVEEIGLRTQTLLAAIRNSCDADADKVEVSNVAR